MDVNDLRGLATVVAMIAFLAVCYWAYSGRKKRDFDEAASLPFEDDDVHKKTLETSSEGEKDKGTK